jgi:hypothetical protein
MRSVPVSACFGGLGALTLAEYKKRSQGHALGSFWSIREWENKTSKRAELQQNLEEAKSFIPCFACPRFFVLGFVGRKRLFYLGSPFQRAFLSPPFPQGPVWFFGLSIVWFVWSFILLSTSSSNHCRGLGG